MQSREHCAIALGKGAIWNIAGGTVTNKLDSSLIYNSRVGLFIGADVYYMDTQIYGSESYNFRAILRIKYAQVANTQQILATSLVLIPG